MKRRTRIVLALLIVCGLCITGMKMVYSLPNQFSADVDSDVYDCMLTLQPHEGVTASSAVCVMLEWENWTAYTRVEIDPKVVTVRSIGANRDEQVWKVSSASTPGQAYDLTIFRRGDWLGLERDQTVLFYEKVPHGPGGKAGVTTEDGWSVTEARAEALEPVAFADNFMRGADEPGAWTIKSGQWRLQSAWDDNPLGNDNRFTDAAFSQNPFAWQGRGTRGPALCVTGTPYWSDYTLTTAVRPAADGAVGVMVNMTETGSGLLARWSPANDATVPGGELALYRITGNEKTIIARDPGGYLPGQWYTLSVVSSPRGVWVFVDGRERLVAKGVSPWRGGAGLYTEGSRGSIFDDLTVYGRTLNTDLMMERQQMRLGQQILNDPEMRKWAVDWGQYPGDPAGHLHRHAFFGDHRLSLSVRPERGQSGEMTLSLNTDGSNPTAGFHAVITRDATGNVTYAVYRNAERLVAKRGERMNADEEYSLRFWYVGNRLRLERDGEAVVEVREAGELHGTRVAYRADGGLTSVSDAVVVGRNVLDYLFTGAPVDWTGEGAWASTVRWACDTRWSFLGGWSHGDAVLWHKKRFEGDHGFEAYVAPKMEYPDARVMYADRYCYLGITICGDGHNPRSGYAGIFGAPDEEGRPNRRTVLMRNGVIVGTANLFLPPKDEVHKQWSQLVLAKLDNVIEFRVDGQPIITYTDPQPISGGVPALWTTNNGLSIARARLAFANPPQPRTDTRLTLDAPKHPRWQNVGMPLTLSFPNACASTGSAVHIMIMAEARETPPGEKAPEVSDTQVTFTPRKTGTHWYQISATDGQTSSPGYQLLLPVFNPALGRDDSHALALYRFDEGGGTIVRDRAIVKPPVDVKVLNPADVRWEPGHGLTLCRPTMLKSSINARKLMAIARNGECTVECWVYYDTLYPPTIYPIFWEGNLCGWESGTARRNFTVGFHSFHLLVAARPGANIKLDNKDACEAPYNHIGLQHQVVTWSGTTTRFYVNGRKVAEKPYAWDTSQWSPDVPLTLGNQPDAQRPFLGTYYLVAIHDRALSDAQVRRHYQAGPSAR